MALSINSIGINYNGLTDKELREYLVDLEMFTKEEALKFPRGDLVALAEEEQDDTWGGYAFD